MRKTNKIKTKLDRGTSSINGNHDWGAFSRFWLADNQEPPLYTGCSTIQPAALIVRRCTTKDKVFTQFSMPKRSRRAQPERQQSGFTVGYVGTQPRLVIFNSRVIQSNYRLLQRGRWIIGRINTSYSGSVCNYSCILIIRDFKSLKSVFAPDCNPRELSINYNYCDYAVEIDWSLTLSSYHWVAACVFSV